MENVRKDIMYNKLNKKYGYLLDNINGFPLDKHQRKVVFCNKQNTIVIAGAGSGKSTTIIGKIKFLLHALNYKEAEILCISFTNESVKSLKTSLERNNVFNIDVMTFHKLSLSILNNQFKIIEADYLEYLINELMCDYDNNTKKLVMTIINLYKAQNLDYRVFYKIPKKYKEITILVLKILIEYENEKKAIEAIDFDDMINLATETAETNPYKYIIIDEYQDSSLIRVNLIRKLIKLNNAKLLVVGDDWQSIYRFSGCDINIFLNFRKYFKKIKTLKIINTYRNSQELINTASNFIMKNPYQIKKKLISFKHNKKPIKIFYYKNNKTESLIKLIKKINPAKETLILGRNNFDIKQYLNDKIILDKDRIILKNNPEYKIKYLTVHKSKGLESDEVIIINLSNELYGFPSQIKEAKILKYFQTSKVSYKNDEERRLFYVALTRTKNNTYLLVNKKNPSIFVKELIKGYSKYIEFIF